MTTRLWFRASALGILLLLASGCAGSTPSQPVHPLAKWDPIEPFNRYVYRFNAGFDRWVLLPVVRVYDYVPTPIRVGVRNFFANFDEITTFSNSILQAAPKKTGITFARFSVNSTIGIAGLFDPATRFGLAQYQEDLGQTLGVWGLGAGPYLVIPVVGPSSLRDGVGLAGDRAVLWGLQTLALGDLASVLSVLTPIEIVSERDWTDFRYGELGPFEYELVRYTYVVFREALVAE